MSNSRSTQTFEAVSEVFSTSDESNKDGAFSIGATPNIALADSRPSEVISQEKVKKENSKSRLNSGKGVKQGKASAHDPQQFIRRIIYKESNGKKILGSVLYYDARKEMFYVEYEDGEEKYVEKNELFNKLATEKDVLEARPILPPCNSSKKIAAEKKKRPTSGEGSAPTKKKGNTSGKK